MRREHLQLVRRETSWGAGARPTNAPLMRPSTPCKSCRSPEATRGVWGAGAPPGNENKYRFCFLAKGLSRAVVVVREGLVVFSGGLSQKVSIARM